MDHLGAATVAEDPFYFTGFVADDTARVGGGIGHQAAAGLTPLLDPDCHRIAALERAFYRLHTRRQQAPALEQRTPGAVVDNDGAARLERAGDPALAGGARRRGGDEPGRARTVFQRCKRPVHPALRDRHMAARRHRVLGRGDLGHHAAGGARRADVARHRLDLRRDALDSGDPACLRVVARVALVEAVDIREQDQQIGAHHHRDPRREPIVVAEADLVGGDRVVLVDHRHGAEREQRVDGAARVQVASARLGVLVGQENLRDADAVAGERRLVRMGQPDLPAGRRCLHLLQLQRALRETEVTAPDGDRARRDDQHVLAAFAKLGHVPREAIEPGLVEGAGLRVGEQRRADLDHGA